MSVDRNSWVVSCAGMIAQRGRKAESVIRRTIVRMGRVCARASNAGSFREVPERASLAPEPTRPSGDDQAFPGSFCEGRTARSEHAGVERRLDRAVPRTRVKVEKPLGLGAAGLGDRVQRVEKAG